MKNNSFASIEVGLLKIIPCEDRSWIDENNCLHY